MTVGRGLAPAATGTTGALGAVTDTVTYGYAYDDWRDLLTAYDGHSIQHDAMGNPLSNGHWYYEWEHGRQLASMSEVWHPELEITVHPESYTGEAGGTAVFSSPFHSKTSRSLCAAIIPHITNRFLPLKSVYFIDILNESIGQRAGGEYGYCLQQAGAG